MGLPTARYRNSERDEERFTLEWDRASDAVSYDILSFSQPGHLLVHVAYPLARRLQRRFLRDSLAAMVEAVRSEGEESLTNLQG